MAERPSHNEAQARNFGEKGIECPDCGCRHLFVRATYNRKETIVRVRICRNCGRRLRTAELSLDALAPDEADD